MNTYSFVDLMFAFVLTSCSVAAPMPAPLLEGIVADTAPAQAGPMETNLLPDVRAFGSADTQGAETRDFTACQGELPKPFPASERNSRPDTIERNDPRYEFLTW